MKVYVRMSGTLYGNDITCTGVFPTLDDAQSAPGGLCGLDKTWEFLDDSGGHPAWRREWGEQRDDIEEWDLALPRGYSLVWEDHLRQVLAHARTGNKRPTDLDVAYSADLPGAVQRWEERQFAIDHVRESPLDTAYREAVREDLDRSRASEKDREEYKRLYEQFGGVRP